MLGHKIRLSEYLFYELAADKDASKESYAVDLVTRTKTAHKKLRAQQLQLQTKDRQEAPFFKVGQQVRLWTNS